VAFKERFLGQLRPLTTNITTLFTVPTGKTVIINNVVIANTDTQAQEFSLYIDNVGNQVYDSDNVLYDQREVNKTERTLSLKGFWVIEGPGSFAVKSFSVGDLTFSAFGAEVDA
jgi:hypothetical protein